jgi:hypothetical protein
MKLDRNSMTWREIEGYLKERLHACREKNDGGLDPLDTARLRGEIKAIKELLALPDLATPTFRDDPGYGTDSLD